MSLATSANFCVPEQTSGELRIGIVALKQIAKDTEV